MMPARYIIVLVGESKANQEEEREVERERGEVYGEKQKGD